MNTPEWICNQIPCRDIPNLKTKRLRPVRVMAYVYWGLALLFAVGSVGYPPLLVFAGFFTFIGVYLLLWINNLLRFCNTVEFYEDTIILRNHHGKVIRTVECANVLYADTVTLLFRYRPRVYGKCLCLWLTETPPLHKDDSFAELAKWKELFLFAYDESAQALLREKVRFEQSCAST